MSPHKQKTRQHSPIADINITPMVDVMLVLLVIFMMTTPLFTQSIKVNLPTEKANNTNTQELPIILSINAQGQFFIEKKMIASTDLTNAIKILASKNKQTPIHINADQEVPYAKLAHLLAATQAAGLSKINFITQSTNTQ